MHEGCVAYFSATHLESHEARCAFKLLDCPRGCGAQAQRQHLDAHLEGPCPNKPVTCPLAGLGCEAEGLTQGTLAAHVREAAGDHAVLLAASLGAHGLTLGTCLTAQAEAQAPTNAQLVMLQKSFWNDTGTLGWMATCFVTEGAIWAKRAAAAEKKRRRIA